MPLWHMERKATGRLQRVVLIQKELVGEGNVLSTDI